MATAAPGSPTALFAWLQRHPVGAFLLMTAAFLFSGALTLDMARVLSANLGFLADHGWQAVMDAALWQLFGLLAKALVATAGYVVFKLCEAALVQRASNRF